MASFLHFWVLPFDKLHTFLAKAHSQRTWLAVSGFWQQISHLASTFTRLLSRFSLGSVWIGLILLKLKTYCWNHCSKIIFKCVNSIVGPIFNEKVAKKWNLWVHEQYIMHCLRQKSQHLLLLFIEQYMNSNRVLPKRVKKKKKKSKKQCKKRRRAIQTEA